MAFFYPTVSTWKGRCMHLEDLYVSPSPRRSGIGTRLISAVCAAASISGCARVTWQALDWNTPAVKCYHRIGATELKEWMDFRLEGAGVHKVAGLGADGPVAAATAAS